MRAIQTHKAASGKVTYRVRFRLNRRQTSETFDTYRMAERFATLLDLLGPQDALEQLYTEEAGDDLPTLDEYAKQHIASLTNVTDGTRISYQRIYKRVWAPAIGAMQLHHIDRHDVAAVVNSMIDNGKADKTIANAHGLLAAIMKNAVSDRLIPRSPCERTGLPRRSEHTDAEIRYLTHTEYAVLRASMDEHFRSMLDVMVGTGMRWGEIEALQVRHFDAKKQAIHVRQSAKWNASKSVRTFGPTKTRKSRRTILLPPQLVPVMLKLTEYKGRDDLVFTMPNGGQLRHATFHHRYWMPACRLADLGEPRPRIHGLRHTHVAWLIEQGVPIAVIQARLGHESITTTIDTYGHLLPETQSAAALAAGAVFAKLPELGM